MATTRNRTGMDPSSGSTSRRKRVETINRMLPHQHDSLAQPDREALEQSVSTSQNTVATRSLLSPQAPHPHLARQQVPEVRNSDKRTVRRQAVLYHTELPEDDGTRQKSVDQRGVSSHQGEAEKTVNHQGSDIAASVWLIRDCVWISAILLWDGVHDLLSIVRFLWTTAKPTIAHVASLLYPCFRRVLSILFLVWLLRYYFLLAVCQVPGVSGVLRWNDIACQDGTIFTTQDFQQYSKGKICDWAALRPVMAWLNHPCPVVVTALEIPQPLTFSRIHYKFERLNEPVAQLTPYMSNLLAARSTLQEMGYSILYTDLESAKLSSTLHFQLADTIFEAAECSQTLVANVTVLMESMFHNLNYLKEQHRKTEESRLWMWLGWINLNRVQALFLEYLSWLEKRTAQLEVEASVCHASLTKIQGGVQNIRDRQVLDVKDVREWMTEWILVIQPAKRRMLEALLFMLQVDHHISYQEASDCVAALIVQLTSIRGDVNHLRSAASGNNGPHLSNSLQRSELKRIGERLQRTLASLQQPGSMK